ncbi:T9SS sorting signal type C domain-containing protein [Flavobacterium sp. 3HN19-14]|uniref:T9SS sorting signal type C domain-containing protein n=1 Tax=Flavobacterium sp. 3HN19-14 TaxID=3448133 RepID=UPI003EE113DB
MTNNFDCNDNQLRYLDFDGDGFGSQTFMACTGVFNNTDCNDSDNMLYTGQSLYVDLDSDNYDDGNEFVCYGAIIPPGYSTTTNGTDCNDNNAAQNPGATEILGNGIDDDCNGITDAYPNCSTPTTWDGNSWSNGNPVADQPAIISANYTANSDLQACSLTVDNNAQVIVNPGFDFKIAGSVTVNSGSSLTFESNANLIQINNEVNSGDIIVKRNTSMRRLDYTYWSSPVAGQNLHDFSPMTSTTPSSRFYDIDETTNAFVSINSFTTDFVGGKGYVIRAPNNFPTSITPFTGTYDGLPNNGNINVAITANGQGFNLLGNPYPSPIDADLFLAANPGTLYFWTHTVQNAASGANYATYNNVGHASALGRPTPNGTIQTGQGFLLHTASAGNATFTNAMRVGNNQNQFFRTVNVDKHRIWLNLSNAETPLNQMLLGYVTDATQGVDTAFDGKMIENGSSLTSLINDEKYVIQGRALPFDANDIVPLNFKADAEGTYTITLDHADGLFSEESGQEIYLKDNLTGTTHNIKQSPYSFATAQGNFADRFEIVYENTSLGIETPEWNPDKITVYKENGILNINSGNTIMNDIKIYDVRGRLLFENNAVNASATKVNALKAEQQVLILKITGNNGNAVSKKVVY